MQHMPRAIKCFYGSGTDAIEVQLGHAIIFYDRNLIACGELRERVLILIRHSEAKRILERRHYQARFDGSCPKRIFEGT